jgi:sulfite reductase (NADPH) hemoprotein beta-component
MPAHSVEDIKRGSDGLRGTLLASLADAVTGALRKDDQALIKYHGSYQQDDRDVREARRRAMLEPAYSFMIRTRTPGGVVSPAQWLGLDAVATAHAERGLRITTRQAFQFHGVVKRELKATMRAINDSLIDTLAACGDVNRNIVVGADPLRRAMHARVLAQAREVSRHLLPNSRAYYELWLDEQRVGGDDADEPIYGRAYLPRKFKIGFAVPPVNDVDVFAQDLGFVAILDDAGTLLGYDACVGGGMGATHGDADTYPRLGEVIGFVAPEQVVALAEAVVTTQRDFGNRGQRKRARLKYTIDDRGLAWFKAEVERRTGFALEPPRGFSFEHNGDRFGWIDAGDGLLHLGLHIPAGRIVDGALDGRGPGVSHLTGLREIARLLAAEGGDAEFRLTPNQNVVIASVPSSVRARIDALLAAHGLDGWRESAPLRLHALACVALPTCGLAMAEAERYLPELLDKIEALLDRHGLRDAQIHLRVSGCPNGCSRPYLGEIALVGKAPGRYNLMLGADHRGQRLNALYRENIDEPRILAELDALFAAYAKERAGDERFGDWLLRVGRVAIPAAQRRTIPIEVAE